MHQGVAQALVQRAGAPGQARGVVLGRALGTLGDLDQAFAGRLALFAVLPGRRSVQHHVFHALAQHGLQVVVHADHPGVDDAHVHAGADGVVQEHGVDSFAHRFIAAEAEAHVRHTTRDLGARQVLLDPARSVDEVHRVVVVLLDAGGDREDVGVEDDVLGREAHLVHQDAVGAGADLGLARKGVGLALLIKGHHHGRSAVAAHQGGLALEFDLALFERDGVDDALALDALQPGLDHFPFRGVDHDGHARDLGLAGDQVEKAHHGGLAVEHGLVHVDVDDLRAVFHLLARHRQGLLEIPVQDHSGEGLGARDVGALADVDEE